MVVVVVDVVVGAVARVVLDVVEVVVVVEVEGIGRVVLVVVELVVVVVLGIVVVVGLPGMPPRASSEEIWYVRELRPPLFEKQPETVTSVTTATQARWF